MSILIIEDEAKLASVMQDYLQAQDFVVHWTDCGFKGIEYARQENPALILLDLNLPDIDGIEVCRQLREFTDAPIIMLTARVEEVDKVLGLDAGADDYVCKPFSPNELVARIRAIMRRLKWPSDKAAVPGLVLDNDAYSASYNGDVLNLTPVEFRLLYTLVNTPGRVFSRAQLLDLVYSDYRDTTDRAIDSHIRNLRAKLRAAIPDNELIQSVYGVGYKFEF